MDREPNAVRVQSPFKRPREPSILVAVIAAFLLIALLKPWSLWENGSDTGQPGTRVAIPSRGDVAIGGQPSPTAAPSILDPNAMACLTDATEQVVILERWPGHEVRSWVAAADVTASGPLDERLVPISFFSIRVIGLGICASRDPIGVEQRPAARILDVKSIVETPTGPLAVDLGEPDLITLQAGGAEPARLYGAPVTTLSAASVSPLVDQRADPAQAAPSIPDLAATRLPSLGGYPTTWPTGSYAISFLFPSDGPNVVRWLRIDLIHGAGGPG